MSRLDARDKATGAAVYVADVLLPDLLHVAVVRSPVAHGRLLAVRSSEAAAMDGVVGVFTSDELEAGPYGRSVRDVPVLASGVVRFVGERVAAVVATSREVAEEAASLVELEIEELPAVTSMKDALSPGAPLVHEAPWDYPGAAISPSDGTNLQSVVRVGSPGEVDALLARAAHVVDETYTTPAGHQGYLEPQACVADVDPTSGKVRVWLTNKSPYRLRSQLAACLGMEESDIDVEPAMIGGDFGGKGSPQDAPLCVALSRLTKRPVKIQLRYSEDLVATDCRHPTEIRVVAGCDAEGKLLAMRTEALLDGGAYGGFKPSPAVSIGGVAEPPRYRLESFASEVRVVYTNTVPKGHMRAPGAPQATFAIESALDELASAAGLNPIELRRRNLLRDGESDPSGHGWIEHRGEEVLRAALEAYEPVAPPPGWLHGMGLALYSRATATSTSTSLRLVPTAQGGVRLEVPFVENGGGAHTVARELVSSELGIPPSEVEVVQVSSSSLPQDPGVGGSRTTASVAMAVDVAVKAWRARLGDEPVTVVVDEPAGSPVGSYSAQVAQVAVDPETGELDVCEVLSVVDVAEIVNPAGHRMQMEGGSMMGFGFACLEDLEESEGMVWAANLGEFRLPSSMDVPRHRIVLVPGGRGVGTANVKNIGESTNVPTAAAIANAVAAATGQRIRELPITSERIYRALGSTTEAGR